MLAIGGAGHLSCVANFAPRPVAELYDAFARGDQERARELHYELHPLVELAFLETNPTPAKWVMERIGLIGCGDPRPPLAPFSERGRERAEAILAGSEIG
jgi:4-hydroxy-tetrahydrodipicolinate synthase